MDGVEGLSGLELLVLAVVEDADVFHDFPEQFGRTF